MKNPLNNLVVLASEGDAVAQNQLGARLATGSGVTKDLRASLYWYFEAARQGHVQAKWNVGTMLVNKEVELADGPAIGMKLIEEAAAANDDSACLFLAQCYRDGRHGKKVDEDAARYWEQRARAHGEVKIFDAPSEAIEHIILPTPPINFADGATR